MKTKVTILGKAEAVKPELKKIEFVKRMDSAICIDEGFFTLPSHWDNIELISYNYKCSGFDLMFAYDNGCRNGSYYSCLYLGHFNDGIV